MKNLFDNVAARYIINFIKESHFYSTVLASGFKERNSRGITTTSTLSTGFWDELSNLSLLTHKATPNRKRLEFT